MACSVHRRAPVLSSPTAARLDALERHVATLTTMMDALTARLSPGPRDAGDVALMGAIALSTRSLTFTTSALWRHRAVNSALADALMNADLESPKQTGKWLKRLEARTVNGLRIVCVGICREGKVWQVQQE